MDWTVEVRADPREDGYATTRVVRAPEQVVCGTVDLPPLDLASLFSDARWSRSHTGSGGRSAKMQSWSSPPLSR